ncbi:PepSY domain-containing protein [Allosphingosinicella vermicomposti]|uniref:PepSY domain-containing protein n=1 Tax=Allosphingosinicella vermicomposti TaxID=614671 RepID=UPI000D10ED21|nr:PepSY domain-containing protein [Allosphingosinicella vermicomposti]
MVSRILLSFLALGFIATPVSAVEAQNRDRDQDKAYEARKQGKALSLREIESRVLPRMRGADYLGPEMSGGVYRLKFMRNGRVIWVDVDARTGQVIGHSGN